MRENLKPTVVILVYLFGVLIVAVSIVFSEGFLVTQDQGKEKISPMPQGELVPPSFQTEDNMDADNKRTGKHTPTDRTFQAPEASTHFILHTASFMFIALLGPQTGGFPAESDTFRVDQTGHAQVAKETSDGRLSRLRYGSLDRESFFDTLVKTIPSSDTVLPEREKGPGALTDYYPPRVAVAYETPSRPYFMTSFPQADVPGWLHRLVVQMATLQDRPELHEAEPGLYARAQRLPKFDHHIQQLDGAIDAERAALDKRLLELLRHEMALVRMGHLEETIIIAERLTLRVQRPLHMQVGGTVYRIVPFRYQGNAH